MSAQAKKKVILIGAGLRGQTYTNLMANDHSDTFEVVAVAEPIEDRRNYIKNKHGIPDELCFESWEPLLEKERFADVAIISTQDRYHFAPAMAAIEKKPLPISMSFLHFSNHFAARLTAFLAGSINAGKDFSIKNHFSSKEDRISSFS